MKEVKASLIVIVDLVLSIVHKLLSLVLVVTWQLTVELITT